MSRASFSFDFLSARAGAGLSIALACALLAACDLARDQAGDGSVSLRISAPQAVSAKARYTAVIVSSAGGETAIDSMPGYRPDQVVGLRPLFSDSLEIACRIRDSAGTLLMEGKRKFGFAGASPEDTLIVPVQIMVPSLRIKGRADTVLLLGNMYAGNPVLGFPAGVSVDTMIVIQKPAGMDVDASGIHWHPARPGEDSVKVAIRDNLGRQDTAVFHFIVKAPNHPPSIAAAFPIARSRKPYIASLRISDEDGDSVSVKLEQGSGDMALTGGVLTWTPGQREVGSHRIRIRAQDSHGDSAILDTAIAVSDANTPPYLTRPIRPIAEPGKAYADTLKMADAENDRAFASALDPLPGKLSLSQQGVLLWNPVPSGRAQYHIRVRMYDEWNASGMTTLDLAVANSPPTGDTAANRIAYLGVPFQDTLFASDPDKDTLFFGQLRTPQNLALDARSGIYSWTPARQGPDSAVFRVEDGHGGSLDLKRRFTIRLPPRIGDTLYVDSAALPGGNGANWNAAWRDLRQALQVAKPNQQIWVARGTYYAAQTASPGKADAPFNLPLGVRLLGGFKGTESSPANRDWRGNPTWLEPNPPGPDSLTGQILNMNDRSEVDGFHFRRARTATNGGALLGPNTNDQVSIRNCLFVGNKARYGGAIYSRARVKISGCLFFGNAADSTGGGIYLLSGGSLENCVFSRNSPQSSGALLANGSIGITHCSFGTSLQSDPNRSRYDGLEFYNSLYLVNSIVPNQALIYVFSDNSSDSLVIHNSVLGPGEVYKSDLAIVMSLVDTAKVYRAAAGSIYRNENGPDGIAGTLDDDLHLKTTFPYMDSGQAMPALAVDADNRPRTLGKAPDPGAYEAQ